MPQFVRNSRLVESMGTPAFKAWATELLLILPWLTEEPKIVAPASDDPPPSEISPCGGGDAALDDTGFKDDDDTDIENEAASASEIAHALKLKSSLASAPNHHQDASLARYTERALDMYGFGPYVAKNAVDMLLTATKVEEGPSHFTEEYVTNKNILIGPNPCLELTGKARMSPLASRRLFELAASAEERCKSMRRVRVCIGRRRRFIELSSWQRRFYSSPRCIQLSLCKCRQWRLACRLGLLKKVRLQKKS